MLIARSRVRRRQVWTLLAIVGMASCAGCGSGGHSGPTGTVDGTVTINGRPVPPGTTVAFVSDQGHAAAGVVGSEGDYQLLVGGTGKRIPVATYKVTVIAADEELSEEEQKAMMGPSAYGQKPSRPAEEVIPAKYQNAATSGLTYPVTEGTNTIDIKLE